jgi:hypothetical protein
MAINYIYLDPAKASELENLLRRMSADLASLEVIRDAMTEKITGDGTSESHFTAVIIDAYGYLTAADAKRSYDQINSTVGGSVELRQCAAYHRRV